MDDNDDYSEISTDFKDEDLQDQTIESDSELDIAINEELISKSQEEIKKRMTSLSLLISGLKEQLRNEKELWRQEIEYVINCQNSFMSQAMCFPPNYCNVSWEEPSDYPRRICSSSRSDEDIPLRYGDCRYRHMKLTNCRREMEIENYRRKLLEVESMCTMELNRVKNSVQSLQVLQQVAAEWDQASGDTGHKPVHHKSIQSPDEGDENSLKSSGDFSPTAESHDTVEA
ncbi:uncharacterized protein LOC123315774 [Coccinella septempunctata]|uniref:uncharacterized protein LOC123315774 n=1 Tax=Coccinella septempunctata TaxID=41139 RepID=UPI001D062EDF|nr:uncharacterized protein LOC123315774 [Coccinella septempunctata]